MRPGFTGNISQVATNLTIGSKGFTIDSGTFTGGTGTILLQEGTLGVKWTMRGGTFIGGSGDITMAPASGSTTSSTLVFTGGNFTAPSGRMSITASTLNIAGLTSFSHGNGTFIVNPVSGTDISFTASVAFIFNHVEFKGNNVSVLMGSPITLDGNVSFINNGSSTLYVRGNKINLQQGNVYHTGPSVAGSAQVVFMKNSLQLLDKSGSTSTNFIGIELANGASGGVRLIGNVRFCGSVTAATATPTNFDLNGAQIALGSNAYADSTFDFGTTFELPALTINGDPDLQRFGTINVAGDVDITPSSGGTGSGGGTIVVTGNVRHNNNSSFNHSVVLHMKGTLAQSVSFLGTARTLPGMRFENPSGITFSHDPTFTGPVNYVSGAVTVPPIVRFANLSITSNGLSWNTVYIQTNGTTVSINDTMNVNGPLYLNNTSTGVLSGSTINVTGDVSVSSTGYYGGATIRLAGTSQTVTIAGNGYLPGLELANSATTIVGNLRFQSSTNVFRWTSGTVDTTALGTTRFDLGSGSTTSITPGPTEFKDVNMLGRNFAVTGTMIVKGVLTLSANSTTRSFTGTIDAYGDVIVSGNGVNGTGVLNFKGLNSTLTHTATAFPTGTLQFSKSAGQSVTLLDPLTLPNQSISVNSGSLNLGGEVVTISGTGSLGLAAGTTVKLSGGTISVGGSNLSAGPYSGGNIVF